MDFNCLRFSTFLYVVHTPDIPGQTKVQHT